MAVFKVYKNDNYTVMSNYHFKERKMSLKAKGLLSLMLSLPEDWDYSIGGLVSICKENETAIKNALSELKEFGYVEVIKLTPKQTQSGRFEYIYNIYETPKQEGKKQGVENLHLENLPLENIPLYKNTNNKNTNNKLSKKVSKEVAPEEKNTPEKEKDKKRETFDEIIAKSYNGNKVLQALTSAYLQLLFRNGRKLTNESLKVLISQLFELGDSDYSTMQSILETSLATGSLSLSKNQRNYSG